MWWTQPLLRENRPHKGRWHRVGGFGSRMWVCSLFSGTHAGGVPAGHMFLLLFCVFLLLFLLFFLQNPLLRARVLHRFPGFSGSHAENRRIARIVSGTPGKNRPEARPDRKGAANAKPGFCLYPLAPRRAQGLHRDAFAT